MPYYRQERPLRRRPTTLTHERAQVFGAELLARQAPLAQTVAAYGNPLHLPTAISPLSLRQLAP